MNPRTDYEAADPVVARAFCELFKRHSDTFQFGVDSGTPADEELRAHLTPTDHTIDGDSSITVSAINMPAAFTTIRDAVRDIGLDVVEISESDEYDEEIGDYTSRVLVATTPDTEVEAAWNVPHLIIYGSLSPEFEEAIQEAFGDQYAVAGVRNHVLLWGDELSREDCDTLSDTVSRASYFFEDDRRHVKSNIHTADLC